MTPADAAELLALAAAFDRRTVGRADATAWADALTGLDKADCAEAIRAHFRDCTDYLMPAHVRQGVKRIRADRIRNAPSNLLEPHDVNPENVLDYREAVRERRRAIADGRDVDLEPVHSERRPVLALVEGTAARLPKMPKVDPA